MLDRLGRGEAAPRFHDRCRMIDRYPFGNRAAHFPLQLRMTAQLRRQASPIQLDRNLHLLANAIGVSNLIDHKDRDVDDDEPGGHRPTAHAVLLWIGFAVIVAIVDAHAHSLSGRRIFAA